MRLVRFQTADSSRSKLGHLSDEGIVQELDIDATALDTALAAGENWNTLTSDSESYERNTVELQCPIKNPSHVLGVGLNHRGHAEEVGHEIPDTPLFFAKSVSSLTGPGNRVISHDEVDTLQYEAELAIIIGKPTRNVTPIEAADHVFGYTLSNDVTAHDCQMADVSASYPWFRSKCFDTFTPVGPTVVSTDAVDLEEEVISTRLNGEIVQRLAVRDRVFSGYDIVAEISKYFTLQPGDIIMTGTADGIGEMIIGDEIEVVSETFGTLQNTVSAP
jgi:2-keto-4-pentenoate hydratase/2-oxohepta-3-ene-1,7-dioic acid hydratase in catechol pathway